MRITILAVGKQRTEHFEAAIAEYQKRISRWTKPTWNILPASTLGTESLALLRSIPANAAVILLDERGVQWSTPELAAMLESWQNQSIKELVFIIGGAHGVSEEVRKQADSIWSLSVLVFPHEMVRLILIEQLYRAYDLNAGGKYHHV